jgi:hypothetical protein
MLFYIEVACNGIHKTKTRMSVFVCTFRDTVVDPHGWDN